MCWAKDEASGRRTAHQFWPNAGVPGQLSQDLPTWTHFEQAVEHVSEDISTKAVTCGPDVSAYVKAADEFADAGFDHVYFHQIGPDQDGFLTFWDQELRDALE